MTRPTVKIGTFHYPPFIVVSDDSTHAGIEPRIVQEICARLGVEPQFSPPSDGKRWGDLNITGVSNDSSVPGFTADGLFGAVTSGEVDLGHAQTFAT